MNKTKIFQSFIIFIVALAFMLFGAVPLQSNFGYVGLALTEIGLLVIALLAAPITKSAIGEMFPLSFPPISAFLASAILFIGAYLCDIAIILVTDNFLFSTEEFSESMYSLTETMSPWTAVFVIAVLPAICEEALFRGSIMHGFKAFNSVSATIIFTGILFGIMHLDLSRLISTAVLGMALAFISLKTNSMILNALFHFCTNLLSVITLYSTSYVSEAETAVSEYSLTTWTLLYAVSLYGLIGLLLIAFGAAKLNKIVKKQNQEQTTQS